MHQVFENITSRVNSAAYIEILGTVFKPWINRVRNGRPYIFQQDSALSHKYQNTQEWLEDHFYGHITPNLWPPNSPDLNPMDYYVSGVVERDLNKYPHNTKDSVIIANDQLVLLVNNCIHKKT